MTPLNTALLMFATVTLLWMYLSDNGTILNRSQFRKFGIRGDEMVATMRPKP